MIMKKFGSAIEKRCLVFIPFQNKLFSAAQTVALAKIFSYSTNKKIGAPSSHLENPRQHRRSCGLAVSTGHYQGFVTGKKEFLENLGHRTARYFLVQDILELGISAGDNVTDHN